MIQEDGDHFLWFLTTWTLQGLWVVMTLAAALTAMTTDQAVPLDLFAPLGRSFGRSVG